MKKIISVVLLVLMTSVMFSKSFFGNRYFETKVTVPVSFSNNTFGVFDFLKEEIVIDFSETSKQMPNNGLDILFDFAPNYEITLNINEYFKFGPRIGINLNAYGNFSKSLFDFIGEGNYLNEPLFFSGSAKVDFFTYMGVLLGIKVGKLRIGVTPQVFFPIMTGSTDNVMVSVENSDNGDFHISGGGAISVYSNLMLDEDSSKKDVSVSVNEMINSVKKGFGVDLEGYLGWDYSKALALDINYKVPIKYGVYSNRFLYGMNFDVKTSVSDIANGEIEKEFNVDKEPKKESVDFKIFRPMKFNLAVRYNPFGNFLTFNALGGVGIYHPFMDDMQIYPEYFFAAKVSLIGLLSAQISTEYFDKCFSHRFLASINLRLVQLDAGVSVSSTNFLKAFQGTGLGAFVSVAVGF